ncbi:MAG TPA: amidase [Candidatus Binataceae bacterium]|nr:amidase [Candidatus Binataceae bacterium]
MLDPYIEAYELRQLTITRQVRPREVAGFFLNRIERLNPKLGAFMTVTTDRALADAARLEQLDAAAAASMPLYGVAYSLKDLTWTKGIRTTMGSRSFAEFVPEVDQEIALRLHRAGGILLGKTTTPEFGGRPTTEGGLCPPARNPWNLAHTAGGSSGGAASALAAGLGPIAEGSDGGGSIRIPAACCGVVGLKPTRGRVSFAPIIGEAWAGFATSGPMGRSVRDVAMMLDVLAGTPPVGEPYWAPVPAEPFSAAVERRPRKLNLARLSETALATVDSETLAAFDSACDTFKSMGHTVEPIKIDPARALVDSAITIMCSGLASLPIFDASQMDPVIRGFRDHGKSISAADYINAVMRMHNQSREILQRLAAYDALLTPTLTRPAMLLGTMPSGEGRDQEELWGWLPFTFPFNATGQPAFSVPNGFTRDGLPIGLQIVGRPADEATIISIAAAFEEARPWGDKHPQLG